MLAVDTDLVVRLLTNDEPAQAKRAAAAFAANEIYIAKSVLLETEWMLRFNVPGWKLHSLSTGHWCETIPLS